MKVYLTASESQRQEFEVYYKRILKIIEESGYKVHAGIAFQKKKNLSYKEDYKDQEVRERWYKESIKKIFVADIMVVEISYPSTANVGHKLSLGMEKGKPVIALYKEDRDPIFLEGLKNERLFLVPYNEYNLEKVLKQALRDATEMMDVRFNFFIPPAIGTYLDWISRTKKEPRAVYLRKLIEEDMEKSDYIPKGETSKPPLAVKKKS